MATTRLLGDGFRGTDLDWRQITLNLPAVAPIKSPSSRPGSFLPARSWCRSSLSNCSITTVQDGNASGSWSGRSLARKISAKRESAAAASLESLAAATMKSWITFQRAPRIQPRRRSDEHCRGESRRFPRVGLAASATPMPRRRIRAVVTAEVELQPVHPPLR